MGLRALAPEAGLELLDTAIALPDALLVPIRLDLARAQQYARASESGAAGPALPPLLRALVKSGRRRASAGAPTAKAGALRERLGTLSEEACREELVRLVQQEMAVVMGAAGAAAVPTDRPIDQLGLDSLMAVETRNRLTFHLKIKIALNDLFRPQTISELAGRLVDQLLAEGAIRPTPAPNGAPTAQGNGEWDEFRL
jgi:acyl carrier protein